MRRPHRPRRRAGRIQPSYPWRLDHDCRVCGKHARWEWEGMWFCYRHHPKTHARERHFRSLMPDSQRAVLYVQDPAVDDPRWATPGTPALRMYAGVFRHRAADPRRVETKIDRLVDAKLGRRKRKPAKPRKPPRDRQYVR